MSCHSTSGGIVSTSLARAVTGLSEKEVQHIFHALKRESQGMATPSEMDVLEWRARQYDLLARMKKMTDTRRDALRDRLFRSRSESVPDGSTFHAWKTVEARARQDVALRDVTTAIDLDPPGSQAHLYDLGEDGRPKKVWYASYGSNLHRDRFMNYVEGGSPEGSSRVYDGCTDKTPPENDIPIRFAGARPHFALTSRVWHGGIAFIDAQKGESAQGLGRAYEINIGQFDEVVAQENGLSTKWASPVPLKEALETGRSVIGNGSYETILHIGDYEGAPVLTFTAPFSTREALTRSGHILRTPVGQKTPVRMPVMTNKPSPAYLRMIGGGLQETFDMDEVAQADYLRGCPGGDRWSRQQMVRILRGQEPDPPREPGPESPTTKTAAASSGTKSKENATGSKASAEQRISEARRSLAAAVAKGNGPKPVTNGKAPTTATFSHAATAEEESAVRAADASVLADLRAKGLFPAAELPKSRNPRNPRGTPVTSDDRTTTGKGSGKGSGKGLRTRATSSTTGRFIQARRPDGGPRRDLPGVRAYRTVEDQQIGVTRWTRTLEQHVKERDSIQRSVSSLQTGFKSQEAAGAPEAHMAATGRNLTSAQNRLNEANLMVAQATDRLNRAKSQKPTRYYTPHNRSLPEWQEEDSRLVEQQRATETSFERRKKDLHDLRTDPTVDDATIEKAVRHVDRLKKQVFEYDARLQETHEIITGLMSKK